VGDAVLGQKCGAGPAAVTLRTGLSESDPGWVVRAGANYPKYVCSYVYVYY